MRVRPLIFAENGCFFLIFPVVFRLFFQPSEFFFLLHNAVFQPFCAAVAKKCEKNFLQFEKRSYLCTRFRGDNSSFREKRKDIEFLDREIACVRHRAGRAGGWDTNESKVKKAILTMKSLILAQDER